MSVHVHTLCDGMLFRNACQSFRYYGNFVRMYTLRVYRWMETMLCTILQFSLVVVYNVLLHNRLFLFFLVEW